MFLKTFCAIVLAYLLIQLAPMLLLAALLFSK